MGFIQVTSEDLVKALIDSDTLMVFICIQPDEKFGLGFPLSAYIEFEGEDYLNLDVHDLCKKGSCDDCDKINTLMKKLKWEIIKTIEN